MYQYVTTVETLAETQIVEQAYNRTPISIVPPVNNNNPDCTYSEWSLLSTNVKRVEIYGRGHYVFIRDWMRVETKEGEPQTEHEERQAEKAKKMKKFVDSIPGSTHGLTPVRNR
jgi:hypothetical protein